MTFLAILKIGAFAVWSICLILPQLILLQFTKGAAAYFIPKLWHQGVCKILGLKVIMGGHSPLRQQCIYVANHLSYLDIPVLGSILPASFIAKEDVAHWPVFGFLSRIQQTAFISRNSAKAKQVKGALSSMIEEGKSLILFPEGTSSNGDHVLPFKSSLFSLAEHLPIQPVTISLKGHHDPNYRDLYAWYGDMELTPHLWKMVQQKGFELWVDFHEPIFPEPAQNRKDLAAQAQLQIKQRLEELRINV